MEWFRAGAKSVCLCVMACSLAEMLLPGTAVSRMFKIVSSLLFLSCLFSPLMEWSGQNVSFQWEREQEQSAGQVQEAQVRADALEARFFTLSVEKQVQRLLADRGIFPEKIQGVIHNGEDGNILFIEVLLTLKPQDQPRKQEIREYLEGKEGLRCTFTDQEEDFQNG